MRLLRLSMVYILARLIVVAGHIGLAMVRVRTRELAVSRPLGADRGSVPLGRRLDVRRAPEVDDETVALDIRRRCPTRPTVTVRTVRLYLTAARSGRSGPDSKR